ncbi:MAG: hypothetical protein JKP92_04460 [Alphaproteobacteria bacterium]|jgi:hypothetical protein|nr:hypothetical protein [Alphaproteobacteria bacterium]
MSQEATLPYNQMVETAFRSVVRDAVARVAAAGSLPNKNHFYITFSTDHAGVQVPGYLRERYPSEMTIVLQHQFSDLTADAERMAVTLFFNAKPERLIIPWRAITIFADPSVNFALQFKPPEERAEGDGAPPPPAEGQDGESQEPKDPPPPGGGEVVSLDQFRKKD